MHARSATLTLMVVDSAAHGFAQSLATAASHRACFIAKSVSHPREKPDDTTGAQKRAAAKCNNNDASSRFKDFSSFLLRISAFVVA